MVKPSEITPLTTVALIGLLVEAGLPAGVANIVTGPGHTVGARMAEHPDVDLVSFTGGLVSGTKVAQAAAPTVKKVALELGGKNPNVVFADACATEEGFDTAVDQALNAAFIHSGQVCSAGARLIVEESVRDRFVAELARRAEKIRLGRGTEDGVECGPLVSAQQREKVEAYVESALKEGAVLRCGGKRPEAAPERPASGYFYEPTVLDRCHREMRVVREEVFGPSSPSRRSAPRTRPSPSPTTPSTAWRCVDGRPGPRPPGGRTAPPRHRVDQRLPPLPPAGRVGRLRQERHGARTGPGRARGVPGDQARVSEPGAGAGSVVPRLRPPPPGGAALPRGRVRRRGGRSRSSPRPSGAPFPGACHLSLWSISMTQDTPVYDYVVIGGGTAGSVIASRLTENPDVTVAVIEGGPSDVGRDDVLTLRRWMGLLGGELDYDYPTTEQPRGNSHIRHSRARVLGGCSSHNTLIAFKPLPSDWDEWEQAGAKGWGAVQMEAYYARLKNNIVPVDEKDRNAIARDFVDAAQNALEVPRIEGFNKKPFNDGVGFFDLAYHPEDNKRSSASVAYLHPVMDERSNLTLWLETWAYKLELNGTRAEGVHVRTKDGEEVLIRARNEVVLCAGAVDSPRLLLHSGVGPREDLEALGIPVVHHLPGVGENLLDHPESVIVWETNGPIPENSAMDSDAGLFVRRDPQHAGPDLMFHFYQIPFTDNPERLGYQRPEFGVSMTPNIPKPKSRGRLYLTSADPEVKPALDFRYFTDEDDYDGRTLVDGIRIAREIARTEPLAHWLKREVAPGPHVTGDEELSEYARKVAHTVYHPAGTCKMGAADDETAVVDPELRIRGLQGIRIADASVFPTMTAVNPMIGVLMVGERAVDLLGGDAR